MASEYEEDWSDSDVDELSDTVTAVQLGVPDGALDSQTDLRDAAVSRIGGLPAFLTSPEPPLESSMCKNCSTPMELVVQVWCPLEESPHDRALYVWACSRGVCQGLAGSVRAWRGLRFNEKYAAKLAKKKPRQTQNATPTVEGPKPATKSNPFSLGAAAAPGTFGLGSQIFGVAASETEPSTQEESRFNLDADQEEQGSDSDDEDTEDEDEDEDLVTAMASATLESSEWAMVPSYPALYLSTTAEYLPPVPKPNFPVVDDIPDDGKKNKDATWILEGYENSLDIDHAFDKFSKRVGYEAEQCMRYELGGTPLPYASDKVFDRLFPKPPAVNRPVTKPDSMVAPPAKRTYSTSSISACPHCKGTRVFECQLMPNLINVLRESRKDQTGKHQTDEERRKEVERVLKGEKSVERTGMGWGTCMIFSCEKDCSEENGASLKSCWREELVLVQWDQ